MRTVAATALLLLGLVSVTCYAFPLSVEVPDEESFRSVDSQGLNDVVNAAFESFEMSTLLPSMEQLDQLESNTADNDTCCKCMGESTKWIIHHAIEHVKKTCKETTCPYLQEKCKFMEKHKKVALGMIIAHVRPVSLASAYCWGTGDCTSNSARVNERTDQDLLHFERFLSLLRMDDRLSQAVDIRTYGDSVANKIQQDGEQFLVAIKVTKDDNGDLQIVNSEDKLCRACIAVTSHLVMHHSLKHIKEYCEHSTDHGKEWCEWAKKNPEVAYGTLLVKVRPEEWGCGFCFGRKFCKAGPHKSSYFA